MADNENIKALEYCIIGYCDGCECRGEYLRCRDKLDTEALDLIKRQQAEIERLTAEKPKVAESTLTKALKAIAYHETVNGYDGTENGDIVGAVCHDAYYVILGLKSRVKEARAEAIKEFADKLKEIAGSSVAVNNGQEMYETKCYNIMAYKLDDLAKEMGCGE